MPPISRLSDLTYGYDASKKTMSAGMIIGPGTQNVFVQGMPIANSCDIVRANSGGIGIVLSSRITFAGGRPVACQGDPFGGVYSGIIISGAVTVQTLI